MIEPSFRASLLLLAGLSLSGCSLAGARASSGSCPAGQTCSAEAPDGLFFLGAAFADEWLGASGVAAVAVGGTETVTALTGSGNTSPAFTASFSVSSTEPSQLGIGVVSPPTFVIQGEAAGAPEVQLFQFGTPDLLDEVSISVASIATAQLVPSELIAAQNIMAINADKSTTTPLPWAMLAGTAAVPLMVELKDSGKDRLVDETTALTSTSGAVTSSKWDLYAVPVPAAAGQVSFAIQAGGASFPVMVPVVAAVEDITLLALDATSAPIPIIPSGGAELCLLAQSGGAVVVGVTWTFTGSANLSVSAGGLFAESSCVLVVGTANGPATLEATASGFSKTFSFTVDTSKSMRHAPRASQRAAAQPVAGDRAAAGLLPASE